MKARPFCGSAGPGAVVTFLLVGAGACGSRPGGATPETPDSAWSVDATPLGLDIRCIRGDVVLGTVTDDLGVEYVEGYRLRM